ncbi:MAG: hypothetical protein ACI4KR_12705, partial [Ruminiclostridium sp.]
MKKIKAILMSAIICGLCCSCNGNSTTATTTEKEETTSYITETTAETTAVATTAKVTDTTTAPIEVVAERTEENEKTEIVLESIGTFFGELPLPEEFVATAGKHLLHYDRFSYLITLYSDFITSESAPECFDDEFSYIYTPEDLSCAGRELTSDDIKRISVGEQIGGLLVEKASIDFCLELESSGAYSTNPESAFLELSGSTELKGIVIENNDSKFYVYHDSVVESEFPFINIGETGFSAAFDSIGVHNS